MSEILRSYVRGTWVAGRGEHTLLVNPATEQVMAEASAAGVDLGGALAHARAVGGAVLREMTFAERGKALGAVAQAIHAAREELIELSIQNGGNTRSDAKFDIDGATGTLAYYAKLGEELGHIHTLSDGAAEPLVKSPRYVGQHVYTPRVGVAVHINAFNFPAWGLAEKAAVALLAGMPVVTKPATSTALVAVRMVERVVAAGALPEGALSLIAGGAGDLLFHLGPQDVVAFTGACATGHMLRAMPQLIGRHVRVNIEADSLNAAVLGPDVVRDDDTHALFLREVVRDVTQKAGQKCTAIRRVLVPAPAVDDVVSDLREALAQIKVGDPADAQVMMGPLCNAAQLVDAQEGLDGLCREHGVRKAYGDGGRGPLVAVEGGRGFFMAPVLLRADDARAAGSVHSREVFGPLATILPYDGTAAMAAEVVALGQGCLVSSVYTDDPDFAAATVRAMAPHTGRIHVGSGKVAEQSPGPGTVMPQMVHGGPGRAGDGEELGGVRGLTFYMQLTGLQGYAPLLEKLAAR